MTTPYEPKREHPWDSDGKLFDPYTGDGVVDVGDGDVERHPYTAGDFGVTPRAIDPSLAFATPPEHPVTGDPSASPDATPTAVPSAVTDDSDSHSGAGKAAGVMAAGAAAIGALAALRSDDSDDGKSSQHRVEQVRREKREMDPSTGETVVRERIERRPKARRLLPGSHIGILLPLGFLVIALAVFLGLWILPITGGAYSIGLLALLVLLVLAGLSTR